MQPSPAHRSARRVPSTEPDRVSSAQAQYPTPPAQTHIPSTPNASGASSTTASYNGVSGGTSAGMSGSSSRASMSSVKSGSGKRRDPSQQLSTIEKSVTHLLIATKQLLETLTAWSKGTANEGDVSDVYVRLGYEFNIACRAFTSIGEDVADLGNVPDALRAILEETLSQDPSVTSLDKFLPRIRDIIVNLLSGLKRKQHKLRARQQAQRESQSQGQAPPLLRQSAYVSAQQQGGEHAGKVAEERGGAVPQRGEGRGSGDGSTKDGSEGMAPSRSSSMPKQQDGKSYAERSSMLKQDELDVPQRASRRMPSNQTLDSVQSVPPAYEADAPPAPTPPPEYDVEPPTPEARHPLQRLSSADVPKNFPAPPPVPAQRGGNDALAALQRGGELERRASKRFSTYQISKHLGGTGGVPILPPSQNGPIPNRGKDNRESLNAVRSRSSLVRQTSRSSISSLQRSRSTKFNDVSPNRAQRISEESDVQIDLEAGKGEQLSSPAQQDGAASTREPSEEPNLKSPQSAKPTFEATSGPIGSDAFEYGYRGNDEELTPTIAKSAVAPRLESSEPTEETQTTEEEHTAVAQPFVPDQSPEPGTELTLFLQYRSKIKKYVLPDGVQDLTLARLQLGFIEKFAWHTHHNGVDLPEIYIQDPVSGVRHELEDLSDIKDRSVLVLNVEPLDEVKRHFDDGLGGIRKVIEGIRTVVETQQVSLQQVSQRQAEAANEMAKLASSPLPAFPISGSRTPTDKSLPNGIPSTRSLPASAAPEVATLRRDLAIMRQTLATFTTGVTTSMNTLRTQANVVKDKLTTAATTSTSASSGPIDPNTNGRPYVNAGRKSVESDSESLVNRVDDLQDMIEDLRKDVTRGVRPLPRQLEAVATEIKEASSTLKKMQDVLRTEKPVWTKIWEQELELVCNDREFLTLQEDLVADLEDDIDKAEQTLGLVEQAAKQQQGTPAGSGDGEGGEMGTTEGRAGLRPVFIGPDPDIDPQEAKMGVLHQVRALQPNHEGRVEAIERAERARERELQERKGGEFQKELGSFVEKGSLRKTGGAEEVERVRRQKDERNLKGMWSEQQDRKEARKREREEEKRRKAEEAKNQPQEVQEGQFEEGVVDEGQVIDGGNGNVDRQIGKGHEIQFERFSQHGFGGAAGKEGDMQNQQQEHQHANGDPNGRASGGSTGSKSWLPSVF